MPALTRILFRRRSCTSGKTFIMLCFLLYIFTGNLQCQQLKYGNRFYNEISADPGFAWIPGNKTFSQSYKVHFLFSPEVFDQSISGGFSIEYITKDKIFSFGPVVAIAPSKNLKFIYGPTINLSDNIDDEKYFFASHFRVIYSIYPLKHFNIGPSAGINLSGYMTYVSFGLHTGFVF
jgi:hypothetical protein